MQQLQYQEKLLEKKWLIEMVEELRKANPTNAEHNGNCSEAIAYLEKRKEQNSVPSREIILGIWELGNFWKENPEERGGLTQLQYIQKYWIEKCDYQKEQKPISFNESYNPDDYEVVMEGNATGLKRKEQKPVEGDNEIEIQKAFREGKSAGRKEVFDHPEEYGLQKEQKPTENNDCPEWVKQYNNEYMLNTVLSNYHLHAEVLKKQGDTEGYKLEKSIEDWLRNVVEPLILKEQRPFWNPSNEDVVLFNNAITTNTNLTPSERAKLDIIRMKFKHCNGNIIKPVECINIEKLAEYIKAEFESFRNLLKKKGIDYQPAEVYWTDFARLFVSSAQKLQKPVEWSEEDEANLDYLIDFCNSYYNGNIRTLTESVARTLSTWLYRVKSGEISLPKSRLDEKDEKAIHLACEFIRHHATKKDSIGGIDCFELVERLQSLCLQPKQEWTEEELDKMRKCLSVVWSKLGDSKDNIPEKYNERLQIDRLCLIWIKDILQKMSA